MKHKHAVKKPASSGRAKRSYPGWMPFAIIGGTLLIVLLALEITHQQPQVPVVRQPDPVAAKDPMLDSTTASGWTQRALAVSRHFHRVYTPCWEGAYGALGDAYLFRASHDSSLLLFHLVQRPLQNMCEGTWVDDRAWVCLAELEWWRITGRVDPHLVEDARRRYDEARREGRLSNHEGVWSWYNWPPGAKVNEKIFTNSNMNQMVTVACGLYEATGDIRYLNDALLVWNGDRSYSGIERRWYAGKGMWKGKPGHAAFGNELPWEGTGYCSVAAALYRATKAVRYKEIAVQTAQRILDPATRWIDGDAYYQLRMDGNGAFIHFLFDAYAIAPSELPDLPGKVQKMLQHVWTNDNGRAMVTLHRVADHGIRNGWNPRGGEEGYGVGEVGTVHAQGEAARAFGLFVYYRFHFLPSAVAFQ